MSVTQQSIERCQENQLHNTQKQSRNRSAFLLGLYLGRQQLDETRLHVFQLSDIMPISKILLLDAALARIELYDCETAGMRGLAILNTEIGLFATAYSRTRDFLMVREWEYVMAAAEHMIDDSREIHPWYAAGLYAGQLVEDMSPTKRRGQSIEDFSERIIAFSDLIGLASNRRPVASRSKSNEQLASYLARIFLQPLSFEGFLAILLELPAMIEDPVPNPSMTPQELRDEFIYERLIDGLHGTQAVRVVGEECDKQQWDRPGSWDQIKRIADNYARDYGVPHPLPRPQGRPPKKNKTKNKTG